MPGIDQSFERIIERLQAKAVTHPNLAGVWNTHLRMRKEKLEAELARCETVIDAMTSREDVPLEVLRDISVLVSLFCGNNT